MHKYFEITYNNMKGFFSRVKRLKSTFLGLIIGLGLYALVWFEKLPDDWLTQLSVLIPVLIGLFSKK